MLNRTLLSFLLLWASHFFVDFFVGIWPMYKTLAQIDLIKAGLIAGVAGFLGEISQLFFGFASDRGYRKRILLFGLFISSCALIITSTYNLVGIFFIMLAVMIGSGSFHPAAIGFASRLSSLKGRSILLFTAAGTLGLGISQIAFSHLTTWFNGHAFVLWIPLSILFLIILFHRFPSVATISSKPTLKSTIKAIFAHRHLLWLLYFAQVTCAMVNNTFIFLLPDILKLKQVSSWVFYGGGHMGYIFGSACAMLLTGFLCDRFGFKRTLIIALCSAALLMGHFIFSPALSSTWLCMVSLILLGSSLVVVNPLIVAWGNHLVPEHPSTVSAFLMGCAWCVSNLGPAFASILFHLVPSISLLTVMLCISSLLLISLSMILFTKEFKKVEAPQEKEAA